ncbi:MAG: 1-acyl-sn-glycerol-3-phosphate acyltransferase [Paucimonas sp.]|jgi:1-acyl-sn-glycerol-3-phosphate acyltransferase|nr:1-acyl-sn-glycerol-3-phosphate acyltransferase [Paucimonas sp.]
MAVLRLLRLISHLFRGLFICACFFPRRDYHARMQAIHRWSRQLLQICGVTVRMTSGTSVAIPWQGVVVCNHVSWLDIFVINSVQACRFVAKSDVRSWPLIGWLCDRSGTIFIARGSVRDVRRIYVGLVEAIRQGESVAFFPEGTTSSQGKLLPFHANLFEAAIEAKVHVQPCAIRYLKKDGSFHAAADFIGDTTFAQSLWRIVSAGNLIAELRVLPLRESDGMHRRDLSALVHNEIETSLAA